MNWLLSPLLFLVSLGVASAGNLDIIGVTRLRQFDPTLLGNGINVAQVEAPVATSLPPPFEVNPSAIGQAAALFTYRSSLGNSSSFPNSVGTESGHANGVGNNFFGAADGVAPSVNHVDNYEANYFYNDVVTAPLTTSSIAARIVNQSFIFSQSSTIEQNYDDYAAKYNTVFISGAAENFMQVRPAASSFNGIGVGVSDDGNPPFGPTPDGRCKPDITAPGSVASFATPFVAGSAAILLQAAIRGDAGPNTSVATNLITLKALLLNGAIKPAGWTNSTTSPLDLLKGAGVINVFNSWTLLKGGRHAPIESTSVVTNTPHPPGTSLNNVASLVGWDYGAITNSTSTDKIHHYYFNFPGSDAYTLTATLVWNRQQNQTTINDLNLFLYDTSNSNLVAASVSPVDNVEHLTLPRLAPGRYDLQVAKQGTGNQVSTRETYALAFEIFNLSLQTSLTNGASIAITWPTAPMGFTLYSTASLTPPISWTPVNAPIVVDTNTAQNTVLLPLGTSNQFFRLQRP